MGYRFYQRDKSRFWNMFTKIKRLNKLGLRSRCLVLPKLWLSEMGAKDNSLFLMTFKTDSLEIKIKKVENPTDYTELITEDEKEEPE